MNEKLAKQRLLTYGILLATGGILYGALTGNTPLAVGFIGLGVLALVLRATIWR